MKKLKLFLVGLSLITFSNFAFAMEKTNNENLQNTQYGKIEISGDIGKIKKENKMQKEMNNENNELSEIGYLIKKKSFAETKIMDPQQLEEEKQRLNIKSDVEKISVEPNKENFENTKYEKIKISDNIAQNKKENKKENKNEFIPIDDSDINQMQKEMNNELPEISDLVESNTFLIENLKKLEKEEFNTKPKVEEALEKIDVEEALEKIDFEKIKKALIDSKFLKQIKKDEYYFEIFSNKVIENLTYEEFLNDTLKDNLKKQIEEMLKTNNKIDYEKLEIKLPKNVINYNNNGDVAIINYFDKIKLKQNGDFDKIESGGVNINAQNDLSEHFISLYEENSSYVDF